MSFPAFPSFPLKALQGLCDSGAWTRGRGLAGGDSVTVLGVELLAPNLWRIQGQVQGTARRPYDVVVQLAFDANSALSDWLGDCSCPVGAECKHAVALTLTALQDAAARNRVLSRPLGAPSLNTAPGAPPPAGAATTAQPPKPKPKPVTSAAGTSASTPVASAAPAVSEGAVE